MAKSSPLTRLLKTKAFIGALVAILLVGTVAVVAVAMRPVTAPPPTIDLATVKARDEAKAAEKAAAAETERLAGLLPTAFPVDRPLRLMLAGDSLAKGQHATVEPNTFRVLVEKGIQQHGQVEVSGLYFAGAKIRDILDRKSPATGVDLAIIELGLNDSFKDTPPTEFRASYAEYLDRLRRESPGVGLLCLGVWGDPIDKNVAYDDAIKSECLAREGKFIELKQEYRRADIKGPAGLSLWQGTSDAGHPNDAGHRMIADYILARLPKLTGL